MAAAAGQHRLCAIRSADPFAAPTIQPNYLAAESDRRVLLAGMKIARKLISSQPLQKFYEREEFPGSEKQSDGFC